MNCVVEVSSGKNTGRLSSEVVNKIIDSPCKSQNTSAQGAIDSNSEMCTRLDLANYMVDSSDDADYEASTSAIPYLRRMGLTEKEIDEIERACMVETTEAEPCNMVKLKGVPLDCRDASSIAACKQALSEYMQLTTAAEAIDAIVTASTTDLLSDCESDETSVMLLACTALPRAVEDGVRWLCVTYNNGRSVASSPAGVFYEFKRGDCLDRVLGCLYEKRNHIDWEPIATAQFLIICMQRDANMVTSTDSCAKFAVYVATPIKTQTEWVPGGVLVEEAK